MSKVDLVKSAFSGRGFSVDDVELVSNLSTLCSQYGLSPDLLATRWEAYAVNNKIKSISMEKISKWQTTLGKQQHQQFQSKKEEKTKNYTSTTIGALDGIDASSFGVNDDIRTPTKKKFKINMPTDDPDSALDHAALLKKNRTENTSRKGNSAGHQNGDANGHANGNTNGHANGHAGDIARNGHHEEAEKKARFIPVLDDLWSSSTDDADAGFAQRSNPGKVEFTFPAEIQISKEYEMWDDVDNTVDIQIEPTSLHASYRFMSQDHERICQVLDDRLVAIGQHIQDVHMLPRPEMFHIPAQDPVVGMGRICSDNDQVFGEKSVVLEADDERAKARVALDFKYMTEKGYSVFPGQIVIVEGLNTNGKSLCVSDFYEPKPLPLYRNLNYVPPRGHPFAPLDILIAAGPFTTTENLAYRPLEQLLEVIERTNPQVVILFGPFVDTSQRLVKSSNETFVELFKDKVASTITRAMLEQTTKMHLPASKIILVPHLRDPDASPLPQPPFPAKEFNLESKFITPVSNPCTMKINGITIGVSSADIVRQLAAYEVSKNVQGDRVSRLCGHVLKQRSYYPVYPPSKDVPIELLQSQALDMPYAPDILILSSDVLHFVKNVNDTICINPGRLAKGTSGGTYAKVTIYPQPIKKENEEEEETEKKEETKEQKKEDETQRVARRTKVEIVRI